jgi:peptide/nickel transport system substrate-binding protein
MQQARDTGVAKTLVAAICMVVLFGGVAGFGITSGEIRVAVPGFGPHMDPHRGWGDSAHMMQHIYDGLTRVDAEGGIQPGLAESWEQLTPETVRFYLRQGVKFHNGEELTAVVVKRNIDRMMDPDQPRQAYSFKLTGATAVDTYTVDISHAPADPFFVNKISGMGIIASELTAYASSDQLAKTPIGTGPFKFVEWVEDDRMVLEANDDYWLGAPEVRRLVFRAIPEALTRLSELLTGGVDLMAAVPFEFIGQVEASDVARILSKEAMTNSVVLLRCDQPDSPLANRQVRQAMNYAINVDEIISTLLGGYATRNATVLQASVFGYNPDVQPYPYDPQKARDLLANAGYPGGFTIDYDFTPDRIMLGPGELQLTQLIAAQLKEVGIEVNLNTFDSAAYVSRLYKTRTIAPIFNFGWKVWYDEPGTLFYGLFHSDSIYAYAKNAALDALIDTARTEFDRDAAEATYKSIQEVLREEAPALFLWHITDVYALSNRINWEPRVDGRIFLYEATFSVEE